MDIKTVLQFRFTDETLKKDFRVEAAKQNKSMNALLNEVVMQYLKKVKEVA